MNVGRMIAYWEERVARGEAVRVSFGGGRDYKTTEKGDEVDRMESEPLRLRSLQEVRDLAQKDPSAAHHLRSLHLHCGVYRRDEQPEVPGFPPEMEDPFLAERSSPGRAKLGKKLAAQIIVGR